MVPCGQAEEASALVPPAAMTRFCVVPVLRHELAGGDREAVAARR